MTPRILSDKDVSLSKHMPKAIKAVEDYLNHKKVNKVISPPRYSCSADEGGLVFTTGINQASAIAGFRCYQTFKANEDDHQIVAAWDIKAGRLKALHMGQKLGLLRTGAIGGVAIDRMVTKNVDTLGIIGTGNQAESQLWAALSVRQFNKVYVYSRSHENRLKFKDNMQKDCPVEIVLTEAVEEVLENSDVLICATHSSIPLFPAQLLQRPFHITTVGPKSIYRHECDPELGRLARLVVTDSKVQMFSYKDPYFLEGFIHRDNVIELSDYEANMSREEGLTLFCSVGLSGTEPAVLNSLMEK